MAEWYELDGSEIYGGDGEYIARVPDPAEARVLLELLNKKQRPVKKLKSAADYGTPYTPDDPRLRLASPPRVEAPGNPEGEVPESVTLTGELVARADPDTEIDRIARLIVDGEYRRRREGENNA